VIPAGHKIVSDYLRGHSGLVELGARVVSKTPDEDKRGAPWVRVTQLDAPDRSVPVGHLFEFYFQLDCYAGSEGGMPEADLLARTVCTALNALNGANYSDQGAVLTGSHSNAGRGGRDDDLTPAREYYLATASVWMHPTEEGS
jgi:hypothetical protein